ncbi:hypothetical protein CPB97_001738 [Podila verticillata]|nr:hypothetical protein CPB97_001738 [Podila verticillata]
MSAPADDNDVEQDQYTSMCAICLGPFQSRVYLSPCMHSFCAPCLSAWLAVALHCPLCKSVPVKLHWGVDTTLGILNTIHISPEPGLISSLASWRTELKQVATMSEEQEPSMEEQERQRATEISKDETSEEGDEVNDNEEDQEALTGSANGKRRRSASFEDVYHDYDNEDRSRSRSVTPIDSYHHCYGVSDNNVSNFPLKRSRADNSEGPSTSASPPSSTTPPQAPRPTRREIYLYSMEPVPVEEYPLADQILPTDIEFLKPFLERDLAVLTDVHTTSAVEGIVVDHVRNVLKFHANTGQVVGAKQHAWARSKTKGASSVDWELVEKEVEQWVLLSPGPNMTQSRMARLFIREMRRIVKRRWRMESWDGRVEYERCDNMETSQT